MVMKELKLTASDDTLYTVLENIRKLVADTKCSEDDLTSILVSAEEIYVNIAHYAYNPEVGKATIRVEISEKPLTISLTFMDSGKPYDPLSRKDPDVSLSAEQRKIGGLGIYMVKKSMDEIQYSYRNGTNMLTLKKKL